MHPSCANLNIIAKMWAIAFSAPFEKLLYWVGGASLLAIWFIHVSWSVCVWFYSEVEEYCNTLVLSQGTKRWLMGSSSEPNGCLSLARLTTLSDSPYLSHISLLSARVSGRLCVLSTRVSHSGSISYFFLTICWFFA